MPFYVFHQNVKNLAANGYERIGAFEREFAAIKSAMGASYAVVAFTELLNNPKSLQMLVLKLAKKLDAGLTEVVVIDAAGSGKAEYIGIAYNPGVFKLEFAGSTGPKYNAYGSYGSGGLGCHNESAAKKSFVVGLPSGFQYKPDYRCLGYVAGKLDGKEHIFGFTHNDFSRGQRSAAFRSLGDAADLIKAATKYTSTPLVVFGGDFNTDPDDLEKMKAVYERRKRKRGRDDDDNAPSSLRVPTIGKNTYDFWMVNDKPEKFQGFVHENTQGPGGRFQTLSDHCGISLKF
jgi:hypothetical protein